MALLPGGQALTNSAKLLQPRVASAASPAGALRAAVAAPVPSSSSGPTAFEMGAQAAQMGPALTGAGGQAVSTSSAPGPALSAAKLPDQSMLDRFGLGGAEGLATGTSLVGTGIKLASNLAQIAKADRRNQEAHDKAIFREKERERLLKRRSRIQMISDQQMADSQAASRLLDLVDRFKSREESIAAGNQRQQFFRSITGRRIRG